MAFWSDAWCLRVSESCWTINWGVWNWGYPKCTGDWSSFSLLEYWEYVGIAVNCSSHWFNGMYGTFIRESSFFSSMESLFPPRPKVKDERGWAAAGWPFSGRKNCEGDTNFWNQIYVLGSQLNNICLVYLPGSQFGVCSKWVQVGIQVPQHWMVSTEHDILPGWGLPPLQHKGQEASVGSAGCSGELAAGLPQVRWAQEACAALVSELVAVGVPSHPGRATISAGSHDILQRLKYPSLRSECSPKTLVNLVISAELQLHRR